MTTTYQALANTHALTVNGKLATFEDLADSPYHAERVCAFKRGQMDATDITYPIFNMEDDTATTVNITLTTGATFALLVGSKLLLTDGSWQEVESLRAGDALKTFTYRRTQRHPQVAPKIIAHTSVETLDYAPKVEYEAEGSCFLLAVPQNQTDDLLLPCQNVEARVFSF